MKINDNLYLNARRIEVSKQETKNEPTVHLWIVDRSGSMWSLLPHLIEDLKNLVEDIPKGDILCFGYFSSEGQYSFPIKGFKLETDEDCDRARQLFDKYKTTLGLTCFSEILEECSQVIEDLDIMTSRFSLWLFTDGCPVVSNYNSEVKKIESALKTISSELVGAAFIGYGSFYNRELMGQMAAWAGGELYHASDLPKVSDDLVQFIDSSSDGLSKISVKLPPSIIIFTVNSDSEKINSYSQDNEGEVSIYPDNEGETYVYYITDQEDIFGVGGVSTMYEGIYAAAVLLSRSGDTASAIDLMSLVGDIKYVNQLNSAFTLEEYAEVEEQLNGAAFHKMYRFVEGKQTGVVPPSDQFCLLDLLDILMSGETLFYPDHPDFKYKRIGAGSEQAEGYPKFIPDGKGCPLSSLNWNESRLNLSGLVKINGTIDLGDEAEDLELPTVFPTYVWRTYTIVKDGVLWTSKLPISVDFKTWSDLINVGVVSGDWKEGVPVVLDLSSLPIINRDIASAARSAKPIAEAAVELAETAARIKVYKKLLDDICDEFGLDEKYTVDQQEFLSCMGVTKNGYNPPSNKIKTGDYYFANGLKVQVSGFSSLPKVEEVKNKLVNGKSLTGPALLMSEALTKYAAISAEIESTTSEESVEETKIKWLKEEIEILKKEQRSHRNLIQRAKFSVLLGKQWFNEFSSRDEGTLGLGNYNVTFKLKPEKVDI